MTSVLLGIGSNMSREANIATGLSMLDQEFSLLSGSSAWESDALGFEGPAFINMVVELDVQMGVGELARFLRQMEYRMGRPRNASRFSSRTLDIDILEFGDCCGERDGIALPRGEILENSYVLAPLAELVPARRHSGTGKSFATLWEERQPTMQPIEKIAFKSERWALPFQRA